MCDKGNIMLSTKKLKCKGNGLKAVLAISPDRKKACKAYFGACDALRSAAVDAKCEACGRSLKIDTVPNSEVLCEFDRTSSAGKWNETIVKDAGYDLQALLRSEECACRRRRAARRGVTGVT